MQRKIGATNAAVFDLNAGCSGFIYGLSVATAMIRSAAYKKAVVIGAERITFFLNWAVRDTAVLFGDGAGAVVIEPSDEEQAYYLPTLAARVRHWMPFISRISNSYKPL